VGALVNNLWTSHRESFFGFARNRLILKFFGVAIVGQPSMDGRRVQGMRINMSGYCRISPRRMTAIISPSSGAHGSREILRHRPVPPTVAHVTVID